MEMVVKKESEEVGRSETGELCEVECGDLTA